MKGKKATDVLPAPQQPALLEVERSEAAREADHWVELANDLEIKKVAILKQTQVVFDAMRKAKQRTMSITDELGYKHVFSIVNTGEKLKHSKREEQ